MSNEIQSISQSNYVLHNIDAKKLYVQEPLFTANSGDAVYVGWRPNETVLWEGDGTTAFTTTEPLTNFELIKFYLNSDANAEISCVEVPMIGRNTSAIKLSWSDTWKNDGQWKFLNWNGVLSNTGMSAFNNNTTTYLGLNNNYNAAGGNYGTGCPLFYKVVGINRKENA